MRFQIAIILLVAFLGCAQAQFFRRIFGGGRTQAQVETPSVPTGIGARFSSALAELSPGGFMKHTIVSVGALVDAMANDVMNIPGKLVNSKLSQAVQTEITGVINQFARIIKIISEALTAGLATTGSRLASELFGIVPNAFRSLFNLAFAKASTSMEVFTMFSGTIRAAINIPISLFKDLNPISLMRILSSGVFSKVLGAILPAPFNLLLGGGLGNGLGGALGGLGGLGGGLAGGLANGLGLGGGLAGGLTNGLGGALGGAGGLGAGGLGGLGGSIGGGAGAGGALGNAAGNLGGSAGGALGGAIGGAMGGPVGGYLGSQAGGALGRNLGSGGVGFMLG